MNLPLSSRLQCSLQLEYNMHRDSHRRARQGYVEVLLVQALRLEDHLHQRCIERCTPNGNALGATLWPGTPFEGVLEMVAQLQPKHK
jgi:hypothetical protein